MTQTQRQANQNTWFMPSLEKKSWCCGERHRRKGWESSLLSNLSEMLPAGHCLFGLQCSLLLREETRGEKGWDRVCGWQGWEGACSILLCIGLSPAIAEWGAVYVSLSCMQCCSVMNDSSCFVNTTCWGLHYILMSKSKDKWLSFRAYWMS